MGAGGTTDEGRRGPLSHLRVLDLSIFAQGAVAGQLLREFGADVIKIERPGRGDPGRNLSPLPSGVSAFFEPHNRGKRGIVLNLATAEGREVLMRLVEGADIFLHNSSVGAMERLGLGYEEVAERNPGIIYGHSTGLGEKGPDATREVVDIIGQARGGLASVTGQGQPVPAGAIISDHIGGLYLLAGILAAVAHRAETGQGQRVGSSMLGALMAAQGWELSNYLITGKLPPRSGRGHQLLPGLWGVYETSDGFLALTGVDPESWQPFCAVIGALPLLVDARFATAESRRANAAPMVEAVAMAFRRRPTAELVESLLALGLRCSPVQDYSALISDPQVLANGYLSTVDHPVLGTIQVGVNPIRLSKTPVELGIAAPTHGQHTDSVLAEAGYAPDELTAMRAAGIIA